MVTVVIPAYNAQAYILETLDSLDAQTLRDMEALVVDDGSTDGTAQLVLDYAARHPFVRLLRQENGGVSSARNHGLREAGGKYILFLDSDDTLTPGSLCAFVDALEDTGADAAIGRLQSFGAVEEKYNGFADALSKCREIDKFNKTLLWNFLVGNKCYRLETLRRSGVTFPQIGYSEEGAFFMEFVLSDAVRSLTGTPNATMRYRRHDPAQDASVSQQVSEKLVRDFCEAIARIRKAADRALPPDDPKRSGYMQEILYKGDYVLLSQFYRLLWQTDGETLSAIEQGHRRFLQDMTDDTASRVRRLNADLPQLYFDHGTAAAHPQVSVILSARATTEEMLNAIYMQSSPLFEVFVPDGAAVPERWRVCKNLHVLPAKDFTKQAKKQKKGAYTLRLTKPCKADVRTLRFLLRMPIPSAVKQIGFSAMFHAVQTALVLQNATSGGSS